MSNVEYHLYRTKFIRSAQADFFDPGLTPMELFEYAIKAKPSVQLTKSNVWHIGNIEYIEQHVGRFAIGRTTKTTLEKFDPDSGDFVQEIDDSGPYTFVYFDAKIGLLGIARKTRLSQNVEAIARKIKALLIKSALVQQCKVEVLVDHVPDPEGFLEKIRTAYSIKRFKATFTGPNPVDADELFQRPLSVYCQEINGNKGSVVVEGEALSEPVVAAVAKSTAATANNASALIQTERGSRPIPISFSGDAKKIFMDATSSKEEVSNKIREGYREVRE